MSASNQPVIEESNTGTSGDNVVRLRGLPWTATESDLVNFFSGITIQPNGITFQLNSEGKPTGEAYVQLASKRDFDEATARHKNYMGSRYIEVFASSTADFKKYLKSANYSSSSSPPHHPPPHRGYRSSNYSPPRKPHGYSHHLSRQSPDSLYPPSESRIIRMRGLPYSVSVFDILDFFYNLDITEEDIIICKKPNGLITGEGFLRLYSNEDVHLAMKKHKERIGSRYIELFPSNEAELESYSQSYYDEHHHHHHPPPHHHEPYYRDRERDRDHRDRERDHRDRDIHPYHREGPSGSRSYHLDYHSKPSGSRGDLYPHPHHHHGDWPPPDHHHHSHHPPSPPYSGSRHFVIRMRGIPFNATPYDIQTFFNGFRILPKGIHFLYKSQNRPAGEAFVEFEYEDDYHRALLKNTALMGDRYIELFRSSVADLAKNEEYLKTYDPLFSDTPLPLSSFPLPNSFPSLNYPPSMSNGSSTLTPVGGNPYSSSSPSSSSVPPSAQVPSNLTDPSLLLQLIQQNSTFTPTQMRAFLNICDTNPSSAPSSLDSTSQMNSYYALHKIVDQVDKTRPPSSTPYSSLSSAPSSQNETTIYMRNLELHTKVSDVEQFFQNYRYLKGSIEIYYNPYRGTNDGHITFDTHQEASRACQEMNGFKIRSLKVQLLMNPDSLNNNNNASIP